MRKERFKRVLVYLLLTIGALLMIFPFYWMISSSFKTSVEYNSFPPIWIPSNWTNFDNFTKAMEMAPFGRFFLNSLTVTACSIVITGFTTIVGAFAFSRLKFPGRDVIFALLLSFMMVPFEMLVITNYQTVNHWQLVDSLPVLIIPFTTSIFYTNILRNFFLSVPDSLYYSARIDGASNWKYLWRIMVPIARPSLMTIMLLNAISSWNSFLWTQLTIYSDRYRTLPMGMFVFMSEGGSHQELILAASTLATLPMIILFLFARKHIVNGVARGGIKG